MPDQRAIVRVLGTLFLIVGSVHAQVATILIDHDVVVQAEVSDRFTWIDSANHPRVAVLAHNDIAAPMNMNGSRGGALREFRYQLSNGSTRIANITGYGNSGYSGFGYVVSHSNYPGAPGACIGGDDSPLGFQIPGTWTRIFEGRHHAIFRFAQSYPRNCPPDQVRTIPVTFDWIFSTGTDNPIYAITWNVDQGAAENIFEDDARAPYGELNIDGDGGTKIDGVAWGDRRKFTSTTAPVSLSSSWTYNQANTVPYVKLWLSGALEFVNNMWIKDATMGIVQTQTMDQQDAAGARINGYHDITVIWDHTSDELMNNGYPVDCPYLMPCQNDWAYQANADSIGVGVANNNARLTWRTQYGFLGQHMYDAHDPVQRLLLGYPRKSYSTYIVLGTHSSGPVEAQVTQVETVQTLMLTAANGTVVTTGPAGVANPDIVTYAPPGYNHVYGALAFSANANALDANIAVGAGKTLRKPLIIISNYTAVGYPTVKLDGATLVSDVDYFPSLRADANELWMTLNRDLASAVNHLEIIPPGAVATPTGVVAAAFNATRIDVSWNVVPGATYQIDRMDAGIAFRQIATSMVNAFTDSPLPSNTAYMYRIRAVIGVDVSGSSTADLATTVIFTDPNLAGLTVQATHLYELRTAIDAVRLLAGSGSGGYTDAMLPGIPIKTLHLTQLRTALDTARNNLGLSTGGYSDGGLAGVTVKAQHFQELRDRVK